MLKKSIIFLVTFLMITSGLTFLTPSGNSANAGVGKVGKNMITNQTNERKGLAWNLTESPQFVLKNLMPEVSGQGHPYNVSQIREAYNLSGFYGSNICGQGFTIAIVDAYGDPSLSYDLQTFDSTYNLPRANISYYYPYGSPANVSSTWSLETATDVEWFHSIAPKAHIDLVTVPNAEVGYLQGGVNYTINNLSQIQGLSMSWGIAESSLPNGLMGVYNQAFQNADRKNIHVFAASGDQGAYDGTKGLTVNFPAGDPYVTSVGGTSISYSSGQYTQTGWDKSGGGYSTYFSAPSYQNATGFHGDSLGVPDISAVANPNSGGVAVFSRGNVFTLGGTSLATPITAASFILIDQYLHGKLGKINPLLYNISRTNQYGKAIVPVTGGNNGYYNATYGWNPVTGLGYINGGLIARDISRIYSSYGYRLNYGIINTSSFNIRANITQSPALNSGNGYRSFSGIAAGGQPSMIEAGICQSGSSFYEVFRAGSYFKERYIGTGKVVTKDAIVSFNVDSLSITVGNTTEHLQIFPQQLYGTNASIVFNISNGKGLPTSGGTSFISSAKFNNSFSSVNKATSGLQIYPFNRTACSAIRILNETSGIKFEYNLSSPSGNFQSASGFHTFMELNQSSPMDMYIKSVNGEKFSVNGSISSTNSFKAISGQSLKIKFYHYLTLIYRFDLKLPTVKPLKLQFQYPDSSNFTANFTSRIDYTSVVELNNQTNYSSIGAYSNLSTRSTGFYAGSYGFANTNPKVYEKEMPVNLSFDISPIGANLTLSNGTEIYNHNGIIVYSVTPQYIKYSISDFRGSYLNASGFLGIQPGENATYLPYSLAGTGKGYYLNGTVENGYYAAKYGLAIPIGSTKLSYSSGNAYSDKFGYFSIWLPSGLSLVQAQATNFYPVSKNYTMSQNETSQIILLQPDLVTLLEAPLAITIDRLMPLFFFTSFISWSISFSSTSVSYYLIDYKSSGQATWNEIKIAPNSNDIAFVNGIYPGTKYEFRVVAVLQGGSTVNSNIRTISYSSPVYLFLNILIYTGIILYIYAMVSYFRGRRRRKKIKDSFGEL